MTWSIIARDAQTGKFGVAVATRFFAVGALVPYAQAGAGAITSQALINPFCAMRSIRTNDDGRHAAG